MNPESSTEGDCPWYLKDGLSEGSSQQEDTVCHN